jgi:hypothetical protein
VKPRKPKNGENGLSQIDQKSTALINSNDPNCVSKKVCSLSFERYRVFTQPRPQAAVLLNFPIEEARASDQYFDHTRSSGI